MAATPRTMLDKVWADHEVGEELLYVDLHLVHEVTSAQAFEGLRLAGRRVRRPDRTLATADHNVSTGPDEPDALSREQLAALDRNCAEFGVRLYALGHRRQGVVHVIGPELGVTQPGMTIVCGDSHTSTHGAFGALAFGIGTSEVEHVLATQTLPQRRPRTMRITYAGELGPGCTAKDMILGTIGQIGTDGAAGHVIEYAGAAIRGLSMEGRMTIANMSIEGGGRAGMIAPDDTTFAYLEGRPGAPADFDAAVERWRAYASDDGAAFDREVIVDLADVAPQVSWGTNPGRSRRSRASCPSRPMRPTSGRSPTWASPPGCRSRRSPSIGCSLGHAPTVGSRICGRRPRSCAGGGSRTGCGRWWCLDPRRLKLKLRVRVWTSSSATRASSGAAPAARCAWG